MRPILLLTGSTIFTILLAGCLTIEQMAPPVDMEFSEIGMKYSVTLSTLQQGRDTYLTDCTRCHSIEPINRYSKDRWHTIIERMGPESKLDESRIDALRAYIVAAHTFLESKVVQK